MNQYHHIVYDTCGAKSIEDEMSQWDLRCEKKHVRNHENGVWSA